MKTTKEYMADVRARIKAKGLNPSKYRLAIELGVSQMTVAYWLTGRTMDDDSALRVADYLGVDHDEVLIAMAHERAKTPAARKAWAKVAKTVSAGTGMALALALAYAVAPDSWLTAALAFPALPGASRLYIMLNAGSLAFAIVSVSYLYFVTLSPTSARVRE